MIDNVYNELTRVLAENKDKTKSYCLALLTHEGNCMTMSNGSPMELCFMTKALDGLYDETVRRANAMAANNVVPMPKVPLPEITTETTGDHA